MCKFLAMLFLGSALAFSGVVATGVSSYADEAEKPAAKPLIKCSTCGVEFTSQAGVEDHLKAYPAHKAAMPGAAPAPTAAPAPAKPLIKCSTCGVEFTSQAGMEDHLKAHPEHKAAAPRETGTPIIKCSTCGVEFTSREEAEEHVKTHPEHKTVPIEE